MKWILKLVAILLLSGVAFSQAGGTGGTGTGGGGVRVTGTPAANDCAKFVNSNTITTSGGACGGGGGSGTVTSVGLVGTANQVTVTGTSPITTSGSFTLSLPASLALGTDNTTAGTLQLSNGSAAAHTIWSSGATTTNTIQGFVAVPTTGHLLDCTVTTTICLLHDSGVITANVVNASAPGVGLAHFAGSTQTVTSSAVNLASSDVTGALPIGNVGSSGLSGTAPMAISAAGAISITGAAGQILAGASPAFTATPALGTDNSVAGTLTLANSAAAAHTIWSSGATTTNTVQGPATVPTTGHLLDCTTTSTTCLLHDSGVVTANAVVASSPGVGIAHFAGSTQTVTSSAVALGGADVSGQLPIGNVGSAGLSGTSPVTIASTGVIACATCVTSAASLTSTAIMTGGGSQASQTPSATATLNSSGNMSLPGTLAVTGHDTFEGVTSTGATGTGKFVFDTTPTLVTPVIGVATGTSLAATSFLSTGTAPSCTAGTGGVLCQGEGTAPTAASAVGQLYTDSTLHDMAVQTNGGAKGIMWHSAPGQIRSTGLTAAVSTATLCAATAGACNQAGHYTVQWTFYEGGTACATPGTGGVTFLLTWTDANGTAHSAVSLPMDDATSLVATSGTFHFQTSLGAAWASGNFNIDTNGSIIQYATGYTACTSGTGNYALSAVVTRMQ